MITQDTVTWDENFRLVRSNRGEVPSRFTVIKVLHVIVNLFLHCLHLSCEMKSHQGLTRWNFSPGWKSPYNQLLSFLIFWIFSHLCHFFVCYHLVLYIILLSSCKDDLLVSTDTFLKICDVLMNIFSWLTSDFPYEVHLYFFNQFLILFIDKFTNKNLWINESVSKQQNVNYGFQKLRLCANIFVLGGFFSIIYYY